MQVTQKISDNYSAASSVNSRFRALFSRDATPADAIADRALEALHWLRWLSVAAQLLTFLAVYGFLKMALPWGPLLLGTAVLFVWSVYCQFGRWPGWLKSHHRLMLQLAIDSLLIAWPLFFSGGGSNPFSFVLLLPVAIASATLPARNSWLIAAFAALLYSFLMQFHHMLPSANGRFGGDFHLHIIGMWANFLLSAAVIAVVVGSMAAAIRRSNAALVQARESQLRNEQLLHLGVLAAGAAHELNTPLSTAGMLVDSCLYQLEDLEQEGAAADSKNLNAVTEDLALLRQQLDVCSGQVRRLLQSGGNASANHLPLAEFISSVFDRWHVTRPESAAELTLSESVKGMVLEDAALAQTLVSLLNNGANASAENGHDDLQVLAACDGGVLTVEISDRGVGLQGLSEPSVGIASDALTASSGHGWGLLLSTASIDRLGGRLEARSRELGGASVAVTVPLGSLEYKAVGND